MKTFKVISTLTNVRPPKEEGSVLIVSPVEGVIRLSAELQKGLGVGAEDKISLTTIKDEEGEEYAALFVPNGACEDAALNVEGAKLNFTNGKNGSLQFASRNAWNQLGGTSTGSHTYKVPAFDAEADEETREAYTVPYMGVTLFILDKESTFEEKVERKRASKEEVTENNGE